MPPQHVINIDLAEVLDAPTKGKFVRMLAWGDDVEVLNITSEHVEIRTFRFEQSGDAPVPIPTSGFILPREPLKSSDLVIPRKDNRVLKFNFVDVQQGDGSVIETPKGKVVLIDGGDNVMFARYLADSEGQVMPSLRKLNVYWLLTAMRTTSLA